MEGNLSSRIIEAILLRRGEPFSNKELAAEIGAPPAEIDQTIGRLKTLGYEIGEIGDRLIFVLPPSLEVSESDTSYNTVVQRTVTTTMEIAARLIERGADTPLAIFADEQTAGRGREGRIWASPNRLGIYVTIALSDEIGSIAPTLSGLAAGLAIAITLEKKYSGLRGRIKLKWPNDIYIDGAKTAGILSVKKGDCLYIGNGMNVYHLGNDLPDTEHYDTTSLLLSGIVVEDRGRLARIIVDEILRALSAWDDDVIHNLWPKYDYFAGSSVSVVSGKRPVSGTAIGIGPLGELLIKTDTGVESVVSGDVIRLE